MAEPYIRNLPVPYFSQRENSYTWKEREPGEKKNEEGIKVTNPDAGKVINEKIYTPMSLCSCNVTCLAMLLQYCGITNDTPNDIMEKIFDPPAKREFITDIHIKLKESTYGPKGDEKVEDPTFLKKVIKALYEVTNITISPIVRNLEYIKKEVSCGFPVMVSCGILRKDSESFYKSLIDGVKDKKLYTYNNDGVKNIKADRGILLLQESLMKIYQILRKILHQIMETSPTTKLYANY